MLKIIKLYGPALILAGCMAFTTGSYNEQIIDADTKNISINIKSTPEVGPKMGAGITGMVVNKIEFKKSYKYIRDVDLEKPDYQVYINTSNKPNRKGRDSLCREIALFSLTLIPCYERTDIIFDVKIIKAATKEEESFVFRKPVRTYFHILLLITGAFQGFYNLENWGEPIADQLLNEINMRIVKLEGL